MENVPNPARSVPQGDGEWIEVLETMPADGWHAAYEDADGEPYCVPLVCWASVLHTQEDAHGRLVPENFVWGVAMERGGRSGLSWPTVNAADLGGFLGYVRADLLGRRFDLGSPQGVRGALARMEKAWIESR